MRLVEDLGVPPAEVNRAVQTPGRRLILELEDQPGKRIITDSTGRLIEVWLVATGGEWYEVIGAFEAGAGGKMRWTQALEEGNLQ